VPPITAYSTQKMGVESLAGQVRAAIKGERPEALTPAAAEPVRAQSPATPART
jgi:hypothetical protein